MLVSIRASPKIASRKVCTYPIEYCEFGSRFTKCKEWLEKTHPDLYPKYYSEGECLDPALSHSVPTLVAFGRGVASEARHSQSGGAVQAREGYGQEGGESGG